MSKLNSSPSSFHLSRLFALGAATTVSLATGCGSLPSLPKKLGGDGAAASQATDASAAAAADSSTSASPSRATTVSKVESQLVELLGSETRYSAAALQTKSSPLCHIDGKHDFAVWALEAKGEANCFVFDDGDFRSYEMGPFRDIRSYQDYGAILPLNGLATGTKKAGEINLEVVDGFLWAIKVGEPTLMARIPRNTSADAGDVGRMISNPGKYFFMDKIEVDALASSPDAAKSQDLTAIKAAFATEIAAKMAADTKEWHAERAAKAAKAVVPKATKIADQSLAVEAVKAHLAGSERQRGIDPAAVKFIRPSTAWFVKKSPIGLVMYRTADVTVGFERRDIDEPQDYEKCGFATFEVKQTHDGGDFEKNVFATGMASGVTSVPCDRLR